MESYIIDIDGTVVNGSEEINDSKCFIEALQERHVGFLLATNSIRPHVMQVEKLSKIGIDVASHQIYTPIDSINACITDHGFSNVYIVGADSEKAQIKANHTEDSPELVILLDFEKNDASYKDLQKIIDLLERGVKVVTASRSPYYLKAGKKQVDTGAFVSLIESITGIEIPVLGKPSKDYFLNGQARLGSKTSKTIVIGDDWQTDIMGAKDVGFRSVLVRSGKYQQGDELKGRPDIVIDNLNELLKVIYQ